ncbi:MAG: hypothetical protein ACBR20_09320 [Microcoleus sp.]
MQATKQQGMELQSLKVEGGQLVGVTQVAAEYSISYPSEVRLIP